jgi:tRNA(Ile)-lysidine synthase
MSGRTVSGKRFEAGEYTLFTERDHLLVCGKIPAENTILPDLDGDAFTVVRIPGAYRMAGVRIVVEVLPWTADMPLKQPYGTLILDAAKLRFPFVLRGWRNGDWMIPLGMRGKKKISDLFTDLKYNHVQKASAIAIVDCGGDYAEQQHVAGLLPIRLDDHYKVTSSTREIIRITLTYNQL